ncbi:MAG TPA: SDR family oxidoreductase [Myxococcaceae bacterium]|nr:SDR family oxidoreductase [Myxococcaceae bacterium]
MKIVVIGGTGLIGTKLVSRLRRCGHEVVPASLDSGVNLITGEGLDRAVVGADVVVDVANSPSFEPRAALAFFETAGRNLLAAEQSAGVRHHLALSVVGTDRLTDNTYLPAKLAQERLVEASGIPYTILRSTQFFEFIGAIIDSATVGDEVRLSPALFQPVAADEVVAVLTDLALELPVNSIVEVGGPERRPMEQMARQFLAAMKDGRRVIADPAATYFGSVLDDRSLTAGADARVGQIYLEDWLAQHPQHHVANQERTKEQRP